MVTSKDSRGIEFGGPANYRIVVQGSLSEAWSGRLAGLEICDTSEGEDAPRTTLAGPIRDQSELSGVLDTLIGLHLSILKVERVEDET